MLKYRFILFIVLSFFVGISNAQLEDSLSFETNNQLMSLEQLMTITIESASNFDEKLVDAPATVIVLTQEDILNRGYTELTEIFDDLPGMEVVRPWGATVLKNYWRGFRNAVGSPYLVMIDGVIMNHLYYNETYELSIVPIALVKRIEIVYGPASSVYGANAFMGVVNVITNEKNVNYQSNYIGKTELSQYGAFRGDYGVKFCAGDFKASFSAKIDYYDPFKMIDLEQYEFTKRKYLVDTNLWGALVNNSYLAGASSPIRNKGVDLRTYYKGFEFGFQVFNLELGYGLEYPFDKAQPQARWLYQNINTYFRYQKAFQNNLNSRTLVRFRTNNIPTEGAWVEGYQYPSYAVGIENRYVDISYWSAFNSSVSFFQDFDFNAFDEKLVLSAGFKFENKDLQKAYAVNYGQAYNAFNITDSIVPLMIPSPTSDALEYYNRIIWQDYGIYGHARYRITEKHLINAGIRRDENSSYGAAWTIRGGYVGHFSNFTIKALYGQAYMEPSPRSLYGGWEGVGSDPDLKSEESNTIEFSMSYTNSLLFGLIDIYKVQNTNTIINVQGGAENLGKRDILGIDFHLKTIFEPSFIEQLKVWAYATYLIHEEEEKFNEMGEKVGAGKIGDLAHTKLYFGSTAIFNKYFSGTLRGRYVGNKTLVPTNPAETINGYILFDANFLCKNIIAEGVSLGVKITNILNTKYFHSGIQGGDAGMKPGWQNGVWVGSQGWSNSLLPQPDRVLSFNLIFDIK